MAVSRRWIWTLCSGLIGIGWVLLVTPWRPDPTHPLQLVEQEPLVPGEARTGFLDLGAEHRVPIRNVPGQTTLHLTLDQVDVDVVSELIGPNGRSLLQVDFPGEKGMEHLFWVADTPGDYEVRIRRRQGLEEATSCAYVMNLRPFRPAERMEQRQAAAWQKLLLGYDSRRDRDEEQASRHFASALELHPPSRAEWGANRFRRELIRSYLSLEKNGEALQQCEEAFLGGSAAEHDLETARLAPLCGRALFRLGHGDRATDLFEEGLGLARRLDLPGLQVDALNGLARQSRIDSFYGLASQRHRQALRVLESAPESPRHLADTLMFMGDLQLQMGNLVEAIENLQQALTIQREHEMDVLFVLASLARAKTVQGDFTEALESMQEAERFLRSMNQPSRMQYVFHIRGLVRRSQGKAMEERGRRQEADDLYTAALQDFLASLEVNPEAQDLSFIYNTWASVGWLRVDLWDPEAEPAFRTALRMAMNRKDSYSEAHIRAGLAASAFQQGDLEAALEELEAALEVIEGLRQRVPSPASRTSYFASWQEYYELYIEITAELFFRSGETKFLQAGLLGSEKGRARTLRDFLASDFVVGDLAEDLQTRIQRIQNRLTHLSLEGLLSRQAVDVEFPEQREAPSSGRDAEITARRSAGAEASGLLEPSEMVSLELDRGYDLATPHAEPFASSRWLLSAEELMDLLDPETLLLNFAFGRERAFLFSIDQEGVELFHLGERAKLETLAQRFWSLHSKGSQRDRAQHRLAMHELADSLFGPVADRLKPRLVLVPSGSLHAIPFAALPGPGSKREGEAVRYLIESHQITQLPAAAFVSPPEIRRAAASRSALIVGDPRFEARGRLAALPATRRETESIRQVFEQVGESPTLLLGAEANKERFLASQPEQYRVLHFASHSYPLASYPELSSIVLSDQDGLGLPIDPHLTPGDLSRLGLRADLVVLSACETGLGDLVPGEGVLGFPYALFAAGAAQVLVSLWRVDDMATAELMGHFYRALLIENLEPAAALRKAQLAMLHHASEERWRDPYYWSAFVLQGAAPRGSNEF